MMNTTTSLASEAGRVGLFGFIAHTRCSHWNRIKHAGADKSQQSSSLPGTDFFRKRIHGMQEFKPSDTQTPHHFNACFTRARFFQPSKLARQTGKD
jgi:hypothetical protein